MTLTAPFSFCRVPPGYVYQSPYLTAAAAPGGLVPLPATQLSHAAAVAAASQFYEYQNAAAAAATYPGTSYNFAEAYPYTSAAAAGTCLNSVQSKGGSNSSMHHHQHQHQPQQQQQQQPNAPAASALAHQQLEKVLLPQFLPSVLRGYGRKSQKFGRASGEGRGGEGSRAPSSVVALALARHLHE